MYMSNVNLERKKRKKVTFIVSYQRIICPDGTFWEIFHLNDKFGPVKIAPYLLICH